MEEWRTIPGFPHYEASSEGRVRNVRTGCILRPGTKPAGYQHVSLSDNGRMRAINVHSLVLSAFIGPRPDGSECRHLNSEPSDNRLANLAWGTKRENTDDRMARPNRLTANNSHPLTEWRLHQNTPLTQADVARGVGVTKGRISQIETGCKPCPMELAAELSAFTGGAVPMSALTKVPAGARL